MLAVSDDVITLFHLFWVCDNTVNSIFGQAIPLMLHVYVMLA